MVVSYGRVQEIGLTVARKPNGGDKNQKPLRKESGLGKNGF
jgi:hypothetical protein